MNFVEKLTEKALDPTSTKADLLLLINQLAMNNNDAKKVLGGIIDEKDIDEVEIHEKSNLLVDNDKKVTYNKIGKEIEVNPIIKNKSSVVKLYVKEATKEEARYFVDLKYQIQKFRIAVENQIRSIYQGFDQDDKGHKDEKQRKKKNLVDTPAAMAARYHILEQLNAMEDDVNKCLEDYSDRMPMGRYAKSVVGIGATFATILCASLDIPDPKDLPDTKKQFTAGNWLSYMGLNDNNREWIKEDAKARKMVDDAIKENGGVIDDNAVMLLCAKSKWNYNHYYKFCCNRKTGEFEGFTKEKLVKATKMIPYNKELKKICYLIGCSFEKVKNNPKSLYGRLMKERQQYEINRNEAGGNAAAAAKALAEMNYGKDTVAYKKYIQGKLPDGHIRMRVLRHTVKIFIYHLFEFAYLEKFGKEPPVPYVFTIDGQHKDYIPPEVNPYDFLTKKGA